MFDFSSDKCSKSGGKNMATELKGSLIIGQSGGPSSVINASAYGVIKTALEAGAITKVYGANHGIKGVLDDRLMLAATGSTMTAAICPGLRAKSARTEARSL